MDGWRVIIEHDGINFGFAQKSNEIRPTSPCCGRFMNGRAAACGLCDKGWRTHPAVDSWILDMAIPITTADEYSGPKLWVAALTGIPKERIRVEVSIC